MDKEADALYGLPLEQFTPERDALVKTLRKEGDREAAARVKSMRKPTVAAWAVNQLARSQPQAIRELGDAGEALRDTQAAIVAGKGSADDLRAAGERQRAAIQELMTAARGLLTGNGKALSESTLEDVADTLRAAAVDDGTREAVLAGRLDRERRAAGLGAGLEGFALTGPAPRTTRAPAKPEPGKPAPAKPKAGAARAEAAAEKEAALRAAAAREEEQRAARAAAKEASTAAKRAEREHELAESRLRGAEEALANAKEAHAEANAAEREARRVRDQAAKEAKRLRAALG
jgi:hypothetical protein